MDINISINVPQQPGGEHLPVNIEAFAADLRAEGIDVSVSGPDSRLLSERIAAFDPHDDEQWSDLTAFAREAARLEDLLDREQGYTAAAHRKIQELQTRAYQAPATEQAASADPAAHLRETVKATMRLVSRFTLGPDAWHLDLDTLDGVRVRVGALTFAVVVAASRPPGNYCIVESREIAGGDVEQQEAKFTDELDDVRAWLIDWVAQIVYSA